MHFLQSENWQVFQKNLKRKTFRQNGDGWEYLAILEHGRGNSRLYCPYGPYAENPKAFEEAIESLTSLGKKHNVTFVRVEPTDPAFVGVLMAHNWKKNTFQSLNPEHTNIISLSPAEDEIIANMAQPVRNCLRNYQKKNVTVHSSTNPLDIQIFLDLIHKVSARTGMRPHSDSYFQAQADSLFPLDSAKLWYATFDDKNIASALLYYGSDTVYYAHAASILTPEHRKLNAGTALLAEAIIDAKRRGLKFVDLYGVAPLNSTADNPWSGFSKFKRSFGGFDVDFGGTWDLPLKTISYYIYKTYQSLRK